MINCQICEHNPTGERCEYFGRVIGMNGCSSGVERKPRNHFEMLKAMSMEEMAAFFENIAQDWGQAGASILMGNSSVYVDDWLKWLKEEVKE